MTHQALTPPFADALKVALRRYAHPSAVVGLEFDDLAQEVALSLWVAQERGNWTGAAPRRVFSYALTIARNTLSDLGSYWMLRARFYLPLDGAAEMPGGRDPATELEATELARLLDGLPEPLGIALRMRIDGASVEEVADAFGMRYVAAQSLLGRARRRVRKQMAEG